MGNDNSTVRSRGRPPTGRYQTTWSEFQANLDAAVYKHVVLILIFLKYVSDAFNERREELRNQFHDPHHDYNLSDDAGWFV
jgi:type I restriction enzyme M protein